MALVVFRYCVKDSVFDCFCVVSIVEFVLGLIGSNKLQKTTINITHAGIRNAHKIFALQASSATHHCQ